MAPLARPAKRFIATLGDGLVADCDLQATGRPEVELGWLLKGLEQNGTLSAGNASATSMLYKPVTGGAAGNRLIGALKDVGLPVIGKQKREPVIGAGRIHLKFREADRGRA
jgi:hypothetical protein